jgi:hypothetical protein
VYKEVDVMKTDQVGWRNLYEFDTPVVGLILQAKPFFYFYSEYIRTETIQIHVSKAEQGEEDSAMAGKAVKLMHRFTAEEVHEKMDMVEGRKT